MSGNYNQWNHNILGTQEQKLKVSTVELFSLLAANKGAALLDGSEKSLWALRVIGDAFDLPNGVLPVRSMTDAQIAEMIPLFRGAIAIVEALIRQIETDQA